MKLPEYIPRGLWDDDEPGGYLESDRDYLESNNDLAVTLLELYAQGRLIITEEST